MPGNISVILPCDVGGPTWQNMCIEHGHWRMVRQPGAVSAAVRAQVSFITLDLRPDKDASIVKSVAISFETRGVWIFCCFIIFCNRIFCLVSFDAERVRFILFSNTYFNIFFHKGVYYSALLPLPVSLDRPVVSIYLNDVGVPWVRLWHFLLDLSESF